MLTSVFSWCVFIKFRAVCKIYYRILQLTTRRKQLFKQYKCSPLPSIIIPPLAQLPVFVGFTLVLSRLSIDPTPFDSESFFTLSTLAHPDPTMTLPVILGFLTMANVESGNWVLNAAEREQLRKRDQEEKKRVLEGGKPKLHPGKVLKTFLRGLSIIRIIIAAMAPGVKFCYYFFFMVKWLMEPFHIECNALLGVVSRGWFSTNLDNGMDGFSSTETPHNFKLRSFVTQK